MSPRNRSQTRAGGNPNTPIVEKQPYILIVGRDTVDSLREEKRRYEKRNPGKKPGVEGGIQGDMEYFEQAGVGGKHELIQSDDGHDKWNVWPESSRVC